jgi:glycosyltransferase involved in cell wall biosynthesis
VKSIAYVTAAFPTETVFIENEVRRLVARDVRVSVLALRGPAERWQPEHAALLPLARRVGSPADPSAWGALLGWLVRRPHVLVPAVLRILWASRSSPYALAGHLGYLPAAARVASIVERERIERVHGAWAHFPATVAWIAARLTGARFSMAAHAGADLYRTRAFLADKVRDADFVSACVRGNADMLRDLAGPRARVEWIYHGVDLSRFDGAGRTPDPEPLLLAIGRLAQPKGFDLAIRAVAELGRRGRRVRLVLAGDGPERAALESLAVANGVAGQVEFAGALPQEELVPLYRRAWALVSPSRVLANGRRDGIPNVMIEALAMGVPCVGTRAAGLEEAIEAGETGALSEPDNAVALADAIASVIADPATVERMGRRARHTALETFDAERNFERLWRLFAEARPHAARRSAREAAA